MFEKPSVVFFGSPEPARAVLSSLIVNGYTIAGVITQPDKRRGRGSALVPTPVKELALEHQLDVFTPETKSELDDTVVSLNADVGVVVAYGRIVSKKVLDHFSFGCINIHYSLLPRWRGAAPVERAILAGDRVTGVSIMQMSEGLDEGPVYATRQVDIFEDTTSESLFLSMNAIAGEMLAMVLESLDTETPQEQEGVETYAHKLTKEDFRFTAHSSANQIDRQVRAGALMKGAYCTHDGEVLRIFKTSPPRESEGVSDLVVLTREGVLSCSDGILVVEDIQVSSKPRMTFAAWANGVDPSLFPMSIDG